MSGFSTVWEDNNGCAKQYRCALGIYLITVLSSSSGIILYHAIDSTGNGKNVFGGLNATDKHYFISELSSNDTSKIGIIPNDSKDVSVKFSD